VVLSRDRHAPPLAIGGPVRLRDGKPVVDPLDMIDNDDDGPNGG
jgi:hypothetical protein